MDSYASWIFSGFRNQIEQLNWMTGLSKTGAYSKLDNLVINTGYPDWEMDDQQLVDFYKVYCLDVKIQPL